MQRLAEKEAGQTVAAKAMVLMKKQNRAHLHPAGDVAIVIRESEQNLTEVVQAK